MYGIMYAVLARRILCSVRKEKLHLTGKLLMFSQTTMALDRFPDIRNSNVHNNLSLVAVFFSSVSKAKKSLLFSIFVIIGGWSLVFR